MLIEIVSHIDIKKIQQHLSSPDCGAINIFIGQVRNQTKGKPVLKLQFETYTPMAVAVLQKIATEALQKFVVTNVAIQHITGEKIPGDMVVAVGISAPHRQDAFEACEWIMHQLKKEVPIWKKEFFEDNAVWVSAHP